VKYSQLAYDCIFSRTSMLNKPKFKPRYRIETVEPDRVFLLSERDCLLLSDRLHQRLGSAIDGERTVDEIVEAIQLHLLQEKNSFQEPSEFFQDALNSSLETQCALMRMEQKGYIVENEDLLPSDLAIFCDHLNVDPKEAYHRLQTTKVAVKAVGSIPTSEFISTLESLHVQVAEDGDIEVVLTDDYLQEELNELNQNALQRSRPWMLVKPVGTIVWLGPIFSPGKTGCWECLAQRLRDNRPVEGFIQRHKDSSTSLKPPLASLSSTLQTALGLAATEVFKWIVRGENKRLEGVLVTHDTLVTCLRDIKLLMQMPMYSSHLTSGQLT
jgi:oxazoline/thiazoline synthase